MAEVIDMDAREAASSARNRIISHEAVCVERWKNVTGQIGDLKYAIRMQTRQMWAANGMVVMALLGVIGFLAKVAVH